MTEIKTTLPSIMNTDCKNINVKTEKVYYWKRLLKNIPTDIIELNELIYIRKTYSVMKEVSPYRNLNNYTKSRRKIRVEGQINKLRRLKLLRYNTQSFIREKVKKRQPQTSLTAQQEKTKEYNIYWRKSGASKDTETRPRNKNKTGLSK